MKRTLVKISHAFHSFVMTSKLYILTMFKILDLTTVLRDSLQVC